MRIRAVWSVLNGRSLGSQHSKTFLRWNTKTDQTKWMRRLIRIVAARTSQLLLMLDTNSQLVTYVLHLTVTVVLERDCCIVLKRDCCIVLICDSCIVLERDCCIALERDCCITLKCNCCIVLERDCCAFERGRCIVMERDCCIAI